MHLQRKTAWSNKSIIRCRVNCLLDGRSWQEGLVIGFSLGKHFVNFYLIGEKRWINMAKTLFYVISQPNDAPASGPSVGVTEVKENDDDEEESDGEEEEEDKWMYMEEITLDYAFTQSVLFKVSFWSHSNRSVRIVCFDNCVLPSGIW